MSEPRPSITRVEGEAEFNLENWIQTELFRQYDKQAKMLQELGLIDILPESEGKIGCLGIDGKEYPIPSKEAIAAEIRKDPERYQTKIEQGFTILNLVPFAKPLVQLVQIMKEQLLQHHQEGKLLDASGRLLELDTEYPFSFWRRFEKFEEIDANGELFYYPRQLKYSDKNGGRTKQEILDQTRNTPFTGWNIQLLEDLPDLPKAGTGKKIKGRDQIENNKSPREYLKILETLQEQGMTPEDWIIFFLQRLAQTNQISDDSQGKGSLCFLIGAQAASFEVPVATWNGSHERVYLVGEGTNLKDDNYGLRSAVNFNPLHSPQ